MAASLQNLFEPRARLRALREDAEMLASTLPPLLVAAETLAATIALGVHGRRQAGRGESFWQFRRYRVEDAPSSIDWRQSAKSQHLYVREREWEAAQSVWFWRDASAGMRFASGSSLPEKADRAGVLALALAALLIRGGERVGALGAAHKPSSGRVALTRLAHVFTEESGPTSLPPETILRPSETLVWVSDFLEPLNVIEARMRALARGGAKGYLVQIADPAEEDFPYAGRTRFEAEAVEDTALLGRAETIAGDYRARYHAHHTALGQIARTLGWNLLRHRTDKSAATALIALYGAIGGARAERGF
jgi:uncharacterized protein (DUF58 family)